MEQYDRNLNQIDSDENGVKAVQIKSLEKQFE